MHAGLYTAGLEAAKELNVTHKGQVVLRADCTNNLGPKNSQV